MFAPPPIPPFRSRQDELIERLPGLGMVRQPVVGPRLGHRLETLSGIECPAKRLRESARCADRGGALLGSGRREMRVHCHCNYDNRRGDQQQQSAGNNSHQRKSEPAGRRLADEHRWRVAANPAVSLWKKTVRARRKRKAGGGRGGEGPHAKPHLSLPDTREP